jgi:hypothetical protein
VERHADSSRSAANEAADARPTASEHSTAEARSRWTLFLFALVIALAAVKLWRSPWSASDLSVVPDSVEYAVSAQRVATLGRYDVEIAGMAYPPRALPWFPLLLAPAYAIAPHEIGAGIVVVWLSALAAVSAAFVIGKRLAGDWGAVAGALALASFGEFRRDATKIMSDVPAVAFGLMACAVYLRMRRSETRARDWLLAGFLCAAAFAIRIELLALAIPFLMLAPRERARGVRRTLLFASPIVAVAIASAWYDQSALGAWNRTGYQFWLPDLYADMSRVLSASFVGANLAGFGAVWSLAAIALGITGAWLLLRRRSAEARALITFACLGALPGTLFHLIYYYQDLRFHLLTLSILCILAGAGIAAAIDEDSRRRAPWALPLLAIATLALPSSPEPEPFRRIVADTLARETPRDATILSAIDAVYLEPTLLRGTGRQVVPLSRDVEYAARSVKRGWLSSLDQLCCMGVDGSAVSIDSESIEPACTITAADHPELVRDWVRGGEPVFLDASFAPKDFPREQILGDELVLVPVKGSTWLSRIELRR